MPRTNSECWSVQVGIWGARVRVAERAPGGILYVWWTDGKGRQRKRSLGHRERDRAKREAVAISAELTRASKEISPEELTLGELRDHYLTNGLHGSSLEHRTEARRKLNLVVGYLGPDREVRTLSKSDVERYTEARRTGKIGPKRSREKGGVGKTTVWHDLVALHTALNWAVGRRVRGGGRLLRENPLKGITPPKESSPARPVFGVERYHALKEVAPQCPDWFGLALDLVYSTGHRSGSIFCLQWEDVDLHPAPSAPFGRIRWRAEFDKVGNDHVTPMNQIANRALSEARSRAPGIGAAWVFPAPKDPTKALDRRHASHWLRKAEKLAKLPHVRGGGWHAFRRGWATARKHLPLKDVAAAGGWKDTASLLECYTHADPDTMYQVVSTFTEPRPGRNPQKAASNA